MSADLCGCGCGDPVRTDGRTPHPGDHPLRFTPPGPFLQFTQPTDNYGHHHVPPTSPHYVAAWHRGCCEPVTAQDRAAVLRAAADKLDAQAEVHGQGIHEYTDLLRVWADDASRWEAGQ